LKRFKALLLVPGAKLRKLETKDLEKDFNRRKKERKEVGLGDIPRVFET